jgi:hypothetical protein
VALDLVLLAMMELNGQWRAASLTIEKTTKLGYKALMELPVPPFRALASGP